MNQTSLTFLQRIDKLYFSIDYRTVMYEWIEHWKSSAASDKISRNNHRVSVFQTLERLRIEEY